MRKQKNNKYYWSIDFTLQPNASCSVVFVFAKQRKDKNILWIYVAVSAAVEVTDKATLHSAYIYANGL